MFELMRMIQELKQKVDQQVTWNRVRKQFLKGIVHTKSTVLLSSFRNKSLFSLNQLIQPVWMIPASIRFQLTGSIMTGRLLMFINLNFNLVLTQNQRSLWTTFMLNMLFWLFEAWKSPIHCRISDQNISLKYSTKVIQVCNNVMRVNKWWQTFSFWVNYSSLQYPYSFFRT